jgi:4-alpha-glucanotransferase
MPAPDSLSTLARLYNLQTVYHDALGELRSAPPQAILSVLKSLEAPIESLADVPNALRARHQALWQRGIEPVSVAWQDRPLKVKLRLPITLAETPVGGEIILENGGRFECQLEDAKCFPARGHTVEGARYVARSLIRRDSLPLGYHRLHVRVGDMALESFVVAAPSQAYTAPEEIKRWGIFCPVYALHSARSWGAGDVSDLAELVRFTSALGGHAVATLPMLAAFLDEPFNASPYAPVSRLFWNELYLDVTKIPELASCATAQAMLNSAEFCRELDTVRAEPLIDYRKAMALKRKVIEELLDSFLSTSSERRDKFESSVAARAGLDDYAAFRAKGERERKSWPHWPEPERDGMLAPNGYDTRAKSYHLYVQWLCDEQAGWLRSESDHGAALYLDFPLGVNRDGYDVWRERDLFALRASGGAPPDALFIKGQNWGFPPLHPSAVRSQEYRYYRECVRHHMAHASILRIDHVMGMHRAFWVPEGFSAAEGLYVHHPAAEYYAILSLESHRHEVQIVGENLGTVPPYVNEAMSRHRLLGMHVGQFCVSTDPAHALDAPAADTVASLDTHDTATFMSFWTGADIDDRLALALITQEQAQREHDCRAAQREALITYLRSNGRLGADDDAGEILKAWLTFLAGGAEEFLLVNLEDLWLETEPQNVPGTWQERPNWRRKARFGLEEIRAMPELIELLKTIGDIRRRMS